MVWLLRTTSSMRFGQLGEPFPSVTGGQGDPKVALGGGDGFSCTTGAAIIWTLVLSPGSFVDQALRAVGLGGLVHGWPADPGIVFYTLFVVITWMYIGFGIILLLAGLQAVPSTCCRCSSSTSRSTSRSRSVWPRSSRSTHRTLRRSWRSPRCRSFRRWRSSPSTSAASSAAWAER